MQLNEADYLQQMQQLLPSGPAWPTESDAVLTRQLSVLAKSFATVHRRANNLLKEASPQGAWEMLPDWEKACRLPDNCSVQSSLTVADRRNAIAGKLAAKGGQSKPYFIGIAASLGYPGATITNFRASRFGRTRMGMTFGGSEWQFVWQMNLPASQMLPKRMGSPFGERFSVWGNAQLECMINRLKPAHTLVRFKYG